MSEHSDYLTGPFERLRGTPPPEPFAPAAAVRRRGRERSLRQAATVGFAALVVIGLGATSLVTVADRSDPPPPPPATAPARAEIPESWLLVAADLGSGTWAEPQFEHFEFGDYPWIWTSRCGDGRDPAELEAAYPSLSQRRDLALVEWQDADRQPTDPGWRVLELVELFIADAAVSNLADVESAIEACAGVTWRVVDRDFAGDQALFVEETDLGFTAYYAVVQVGAAVATVRSTDAPLVRDLAHRAATRLR